MTIASGRAGRRLGVWRSVIDTWPFVAAVFDGVVDQVLEQLDQFVALAHHHAAGLRRVRSTIVMSSAWASGASAAAASRTTASTRNLARGRDMLVQFDPGERQKIFDQPAHAAGLDAHDVEEFLAGRLVVFGVALAACR